MADFSKITVNGTKYNVKDATARTEYQYISQAHAETVRRLGLVETAANEISQIKNTANEALDNSEWGIKTYILNEESVFEEYAEAFLNFEACGAQVFYKEGEYVFPALCKYDDYFIFIRFETIEESGNMAGNIQYILAQPVDDQHEEMRILPYCPINRGNTLVYNEADESLTLVLNQ